MRGMRHTSAAHTTEPSSGDMDAGWTQFSNQMKY